MPVTTYATSVEPDTVTFRLPDPGESISEVTLWSEVPVAPRLFTPTDQGWELTVPHPGAHRIEYLFEASDGQHSTTLVDPTNPLRVDGVFGEHSWLPMPGYTEPAWLDSPQVEQHTEPVAFATADGDVTGASWVPAGLDDAQPAPLLVCHDGTQMARYGRLTDFLATAVHAGAAAPLRVLLLDPGPHRNTRYAANSSYADALINEILPSVADARPIAGRPVLMGQSLGALAALHAARRHPGTIAGLFLQSGSFFTAEFDPQERGYSHWVEVTGFTSTLYTTPTPEPELPIYFVCGSQEENFVNNRALAAHLAAQGQNLGWADVPDGHTWTTWRDLLDPHLTRLLTEAWR